ncbi:hypothetical protein PUMCH_000343 [Australozyma saopauloensis]|uniref:protein-serine/threonine phosphatase n=1 Tax=Australozyma saopauloensis TaxID=291208 RepID=A0AAX4H3X6_9ASCO|nr:hypothetical protein PUMCH_000343 [[Candida] saopauloensis]
MGQLLSHPVEEKAIDFRSFDSMTYCIGSMQGYRMTMEDAHDVRISEDESLAVFGVFDGHGGKDVAELLRKRLVASVFKELNILVRANKNVELATLTKTIKNCFFAVDSGLPEPAASNCGSTAIVTTIVANKYVIVSNTGDSRSILSMKGGLPKNLSFDHKPSNMGERVRIENSGGYVINSRVNEILALSRAFGDYKFKLPWLQLAAPGNNNSFLEQNRKLVKNNLVALPPELYQVTVEPEFVIYDIAALSNPEFVVLACDGIWDCYTNNQLILLIRKKLRDRWSLQHITEYILNDCISMASSATGIGFDNMTLMIIAIHPDSTMDDWSIMMEKRVNEEEMRAEAA